jgi:hypothetical protein
MTKPTLAIGGKIGILSKDIFRALPFLKLDQETFAANIDPERKPRLLAIEVRLLEIGIRQRRRTEIEEHLTQLRAAKPTAALLIVVSGSCRGVRRTHHRLAAQHRAAPFSL